jgi:carotenoid 1,2-hydratase
VFSPYYAWARRRGAADPLRHCALNVALYGRGSRRWAMTERGRETVWRDVRHLSIGPSALEWDGVTLTAQIDELNAPLPLRVRGVVRLHPLQVETRVMTLDAASRHRWSPIAPRARIEVALEHPALRWSGYAYCDTNAGDVPLEADFRGWTWCRAQTDIETIILYDVATHDGGRRSLALRYAAGEEPRSFDPPPERRLSRTRWGIARTVRGDTATAARVVSTLQDTPFYARSLVATQLLGTPVMAVHESLNLERFRNPLVQAILPFRMPRTLQRSAKPGHRFPET